MWGALVATPPHVEVAELRYQGVGFGQFFRNRVSDLCTGLRLTGVPGMSRCGRSRGFRRHSRL